MVYTGVEIMGGGISNCFQVQVLFMGIIYKTLNTLLMGGGF